MASSHGERSYKVVDMIFWDNDGVLVDTEDLYYRATREAMRKTGFDLTKELYVEYFLLKGTGA